jgi:beta-galactosidase beta subunit
MFAGGLKISILLIVLLFLSCEEEQPEPPGKPSDKQYIGTWSGNTNEGLLVKIQVDSIDQWTRVERVIINYYHDSAKLSLYKANTDGLTKIDEGSFELDFGNGDNLKGKFSGDNLLVGTIMLNGLERHFSSTNEALEANINSISQARYNFKNNQYFFRQDHYDTLTRLEHQLTYYHRKYFSSSLKLRPPVNDSIRFVKITKGRLSNLWSEDAFVQFFGPGKRNYSFEGRNGIEIVLFDANDNFRKWTTSLDTANQQGSTFEIIETLMLENNLRDKVIVKLVARFDCMMYDGKGNEEWLSEGRFIGLFEHELEK